jgi:hypothetical protein
MTDAERQAIEQACARLPVLFHNYVDAFEHDRLLELFATDGVWDQVFKGELRGHAAIKGYLDSKNTTITTMHMVSNVAIEVIDKSHARGIAYYAYYHAEPGVALPAPLRGPTAAGRYLDEYVLTEKGWKFAARRPKNLFQAEDVAALSIVKR